MAAHPCDVVPVTYAYDVVPAQAGTQRFIWLDRMYRIKITKVHD